MKYSKFINYFTNMCNISFLAIYIYVASKKRIGWKIGTKLGFRPCPIFHPCAPAVLINCWLCFLRLDVCMDDFVVAAAADEDTRKTEEPFPSTSSSSCDEL
jgi:hypothetical protein